MEYLISKRDTERANQPAVRGVEVGMGMEMEMGLVGQVYRFGGET